MKIILLIALSVGLLLADSLDSLLQEYKTTSDNSLQTVNEKIGHVIIYSQKEIRLMQYTKLNDILKELPLLNVNTNQFGLTNYSLIGSKTTTSGFFRFFINDHEISSGYDQSTSLSWSDLPLDFVDHVEIYYGESSFSFGNETGIYFVRIYTKSALKENGSELNGLVTTKGSHSESFTNSSSLENGWSYLMFLNHEQIKHTTLYDGHKLNTNGDKKYLYTDISNETTKINMGYTDVSKNNYAGLALDATPDSGQNLSKDFFINYTHYFLDDKSLKANLSVDVNDRSYDEANTQGIGLIPVLNFSNLGATIPKNFNEDLRFVKTNAYLSKSFDVEDNTFIAALNVKNKTYDVQNRETTNFMNQTRNVGNYNAFDEETTSSVLFQDNYKLNDTLILVANAKLDSYDRNAYLQDSTETLLRVGAIYTPTENWGFKSFYTQTALPPSFYNVDYADRTKPNLKSQQYYIYTLEAVYTKGDSKFGINYNHVDMDNFLYLTPVGFINIDRTITTNGLIFDYEYSFSDRDKIKLNYYTSNLSETVNNSTKGGFIKFMGGYQKFDYFTSVIYRNGYEYLNLDIPDSFDMSLGATYHVTKDLSYSIKASNILDKSTKSLYLENFGRTNFALDDNDRSVTFSFRWVF
ncbi:outer membrane protein [Sulfurospirillum diekertiae]|uniref:Outer membrane protein n=1 Tax=Sulfurospirillum diekertiae TaxID=1854492 RepID=A0A290HBQ0_9BACT|nr:TonB-dependent receptor [Sulfurospirillum diekertiae]ATB68651.1 outer membrane protein [Sulfurospirillum diekertiae]